jgi:hypothetical protein
MENKTSSRVLSERAFAETVGLSYQQIKKMRQEGKIRYCRVGRRVLYKYPEHVEAFLSEHEKFV